MRYLHNQKHDASEEDRFICINQIQWFNQLEGVAKAANEEDLSIFYSIYLDFNSKQKKSDKEIKGDLLFPIYF